MNRSPARRLAGLVLAVLLASLTTGCAATRMKAWDRDLLSEKKMRFIPSASEFAVDQHIYFSKEGSTGGQDVGGGGCGCN